MSEILLDESVGYVNVQFGENSITLDLFEVNDRIADLHASHEGKPAAEYAAAVQDLLVELGLPRVSVFAAGRFVKQIVDACEDLKKKHALLPASPVSTASTPSD